MSQDNVKLVIGLQPDSTVDVARLFRDPAMSQSLSEAVAPYVHQDFEVVFNHALRGAMTYHGIDGLREAWLDWLSPWEAYRTEIQEALDFGEHVLLLVQDFGRREGSTQEVVLNGAAIWTIRDMQIVRVEFHNDRTSALEVLEPAS